MFILLTELIICYVFLKVKYYFLKRLTIKLNKNSEGLTISVSKIADKVYLSIPLSDPANTDYEMDRISRSDYFNFPNKTDQGRPSQFFFNRQISPVITLWQSPENSTDQIVYYYVRRLEDADAMVNTGGVPFRFYPCMVAGLAYYMAMKRAPDRLQILKAVYDEEFQRASDEDRDRVPLKLQPSVQYLRT